jgi:hypothetical protein
LHGGDCRKFRREKGIRPCRDSRVVLACVYALLDRKDEAFGWLFKSLDAGFDASGTLRGDDDLDNLRGDPRFRQALARAKDLGQDLAD